MKQILSGFLLVSLSAECATGANLQITVRLVNGDVIAGRIRLAGERTAERIVRTAGIELIWMECGRTIPSPCGKNLNPGEFWLHVVAGEAPRSLPDAAGFAVLYPTTWGRDGYAGVFYRKVIETARSEECDPGLMLGATMAHEIGHLLLGSNAHSDRGVMRARVKREDVMQASRGELRFTTADAEADRKSVV